MASALLRSDPRLLSETDPGDVWGSRGAGEAASLAEITPTAWMMPAIGRPTPSPVLSVGHFKRALMGHSCEALKSMDTGVSPFSARRNQRLFMKH